MAHASTHSGYDFTPEQAIDKIKAERKRKSALVAAAFVAGALAFGTSVYLAYQDVPAPENPANAVR
jgi:hypothetical protein